MSINKYRPHIYFLPEDDATRQLAVGFYQKVPDQRLIQILPPAGGWTDVVEQFLVEYAPTMQDLEHRYVVLVIDFDGDAKRLQYIQSKIDPSLLSRVFVLGSLLEAENLRREIGKNFEVIGQMLAEDCENQTKTVWGHPLLQPFEHEIERARNTLGAFIFS